MDLLALCKMYTHVHRTPALVGVEQSAGMCIAATAILKKVSWKHQIFEVSLLQCFYFINAMQCRNVPFLKKSVPKLLKMCFLNK